jgi:hypothetical protein
MEPRAFVFEPGNLDVSGASVYGKIVHIFKRNDRRSSIWAPEFPGEIIERLKEFDFRPDKDFIVVVGHMVTVVMLVTTALEHWKGVNLLLFSATERSYIPRIIGELNESRIDSSTQGSARLPHGNVSST